MTLVPPSSGGNCSGVVAVTATPGGPTFGLTTFGNTPTITQDGTYSAFPGFAWRAGKLFCAYYKGTQENSGDGQIVLKTSSDGGLTWTGETVLQASGGHDYRDPSLILTRTGRLVCNYFDYPGNTGGAANTFIGPYQIVSDDGGASWSARTKYTFYNTWGGASRYLQHSSGVLLQLVWGQNAGDADNRLGLVRSLDDGNTWGSVAAITGVGYDESSMVELANGNVLVFIRNNTAGTNIYKSISTDVGLTWSVPVGLGWNVTPGRPEATRFAQSGEIVLNYRHAGDTFAYEAISVDDGVTWGAQTLLSGAHYSYAGGCQLPQNMIGFAEAFQLSVSSTSLQFIPWGRLPSPSQIIGS